MRSREATPSAVICRELARRMARESVIVFLKPSAFSEGSDSGRWLPLAEKGQCRQSRNWVYHREDIAKGHAVFEGLPAGGIIDWYYYLQLTPPVAFRRTVRARRHRCGCFRSRRRRRKRLLLGIDHRKLPVRAGPFVLNTFRVLENLDQVPAASRLLLNIMAYAANLVQEPPTPLGPDFERHLQTIGYNR